MFESSKKSYVFTYPLCRTSFALQLYRVIATWWTNHSRPASETNGRSRFGSIQETIVSDFQLLFNTPKTYRRLTAKNILQSHAIDIICFCIKRNIIERIFFFSQSLIFLTHSVNFGHFCSVLKT